MGIIIKRVLLVMLLVSATAMQAADEVPDDLQLRLGGYILADQSTDVKLSHNGTGVTINLQDAFKMEKSAQVIRFDGYYRFTPKHSIEFAWYAIHNSSHTDKAFPWFEDNISASGNLNTFFNTDIYKVNYVYSFYHSDEVEIGLSAGLHITKLELGFDGTYELNGSGENAEQSVDVTAPLPVIGLRLSYNILPSLRVKYEVDYFFVTFDGAVGSMSDSLLTLDYRIFKHFGLGIGINSTRMRFEVDAGANDILNLNHDVAGGFFYATANF